MMRASLAAALYVLALGLPASAVPIAYDGFDYPVGQLKDQNGGSGDWKEPWKGDNDLQVLAGGWGYTDSLGNVLDATGNHIGLTSSLADPKKSDRKLTSKVGQNPETFWLSVILDGSDSVSVNNFGIQDKFFFGQGDKDTGSLNWQLSDSDGLIADTGISAENRAFLVVRIDFTAGDEDVWLWVNPNLDLEPALLTADASGTAKNFNQDQIRMRLQDAGAVGFDELRVGATWADVTPHTPVPEPSVALLLGAGLAATGAVAGRRKSRTAGGRSAA
jgi:hypothetical protein